MNGLVDAIGAGWEHCEFPNLPAEFLARLVCAVHMHQVEPKLTAKLKLMVRNPSGDCILEEEFTMHSGERRPVVIASAAITLRFPVTEAGVWSIVVLEGDQELGWLPLEMKVLAAHPSASEGATPPIS
ncbi:MAG: hypothetical protein JWP97_6513 [Labilithrix sp.]|nr:hypothetical protein [Labilithrix sp.]